MNSEHADVLALTVQTHQACSTLGSRQHEARVRHVVPQVNVSPSAEDPAAVLQRDVGLDGNGVGADDRTVGSALTLDLTALSVARLTFGEQPLVVFAAVAVRVSG